MVKRMLIDATHAEETRVVVLNGSRLDEFDVETSTKRQLKGNIYLAKIVRVEPSLQAAFVEYGGGRHGFLAFNEIHPDYYQIPVADRQALIAEHRAAMRASGAAASADFDDGDGDEHRGRHRRRGGEESPERAALPEGGAVEGESQTPIDAHESDGDAHGHHDHSEAHAESGAEDAADRRMDHVSGEGDRDADTRSPQEYGPPAPDFASRAENHDHDHRHDEHAGAGEEERDSEGNHDAGREHHGADDHGDHSDGVPPTVAASMPVVEIAAPLETVDAGGGDDVEDVEPRRHRPLRHYKIQEVIKRRQIVLVQVVKEERGTKGAALTTYLSLAGRYCVLMPNTARGGGVSRKITNAADRKRLKTVVNELEIPDGMAVIIRTAGSERTKPEIKRDYEYLLRLWDSVRELTLQSTAPALVYEEANLIKRSIRDLYARDIDEILVEGDEGYRLAKDFMRMLTPSHAKKVQLYKDPAIPLFHRFQVEAQLDAMHSPSVQLKSGGYIVLNQTEALVAIDVNSGRATRERHIEETAFKTNMEAADEVARQLRLRDLAGLIVIDFIDMEESRNNHAVERRLKDAMRLDRARIQLGRISPFGLLELSRQRLRPSLMENSFQTCTHCGGTGMMRSVESSAVHVLRAIEDEGIRRRGGEIRVTVQTQVALYLLNQKRDALQAIEMRYVMRVLVVGDDSLIPPAHRIERTKTETPPELLARPVHMETGLIEAPPVETEVAEEVEEVEEEEAAPQEARPPQEQRRHEPHNGQGGEGEGGGRKRRRRRRRGRRDDGGQPMHEMSAASVVRPETEDAELAETADGDTGETATQHAPPAPQPGGIEGEAAPRRRRRGKRGGRRRNRGRDGTNGLPMSAEPSDHSGESDGGDYGFADESAEDAQEGMGGETASPVTESSAPAVHQPHEDHSAPVQSSERAASADTGTHARRSEEPATHAEPQAPAAPAAAPPATPAPEPEQPSGPPRRGWWNRVI